MILESVKDIINITAKKSAEIIEVTKIQYEINTKEDERNKIFTELGKKFYNSRQEGGSLSEEVNETLFSKIRHIDAEIGTLKRKLAKIKEAVFCPSCGADNPKNSVFCSKCGYKFNLPGNTSYWAGADAEISAEADSAAEAAHDTDTSADSGYSTGSPTGTDGDYGTGSGNQNSHEDYHE